MKISVVIPTLNEQAVIESSIAQAWMAGADEVILADGGSEDGTLELASSSRCHVVASAAGRASQMNAGANAASGDMLLFMHADNWLTESGCDQIRAASNQSGALWGGFRQQIEGSGVLYRWIERGNSLRCRWQGLVYGDQGLFVDRRLFEAMGGYAEVPLMEDFELSRRLATNKSPTLLPGPIHVSARRWRATGIVRQTIRNWRIASAYRLGVSPERLAKWYDA